MCVPFLKKLVLFRYLEVQSGVKDWHINSSLRLFKNTTLSEQVQNGYM